MMMVDHGGRHSEDKRERGSGLGLLEAGTQVGLEGRHCMAPTLLGKYEASYAYAVKYYRHIY